MPEVKKTPSWTIITYDSIYDSGPAMSRQLAIYDAACASRRAAYVEYRSLNETITSVVEKAFDNSHHEQGDCTIARFINGTQVFPNPLDVVL